MTAVFEVKTPKIVTLQHASTLASLRNETQKVDVVVTRRFKRRLLYVLLMYILLNVSLNPSLNTSLLKDKKYRRMSKNLQKTAASDSLRTCQINHLLETKTFSKPCLFLEIVDG